MGERRSDIDWIRSIALLFFVIYQALCVFCGGLQFAIPMQEPELFSMCNLALAVVEPFYLSLFFFLSGFCVFSEMYKKRTGQFLKKRAGRFLVPFAVVCFLVNPLTCFMAACSIGSQDSFFKCASLYFETIFGNIIGEEYGIATLHVSVLFFLFLFSVAGFFIFRAGKACCWDYERIFARSKEVTYSVYKDWKKASFFSAVADFCERPFALLIIMLPVPFLYLCPGYQNFNPVAWFYVFLLGYLFATDVRYQRALDRDKWIYLGITVLLYVFYLICLFVPSFEGSGIVLTVLEKYIGAFLKILPVFVILGFAHSFLPEGENRCLHYVKRAAFPVYLMHMPVLLLVIGLCNRIQAPVYLTLFLMMFGTLFLCLCVWQLYQKGKSFFIPGHLSHAPDMEAGTKGYQEKI